PCTGCRASSSLRLRDNQEFQLRKARAEQGRSIRLYGRLGADLSRMKSPSRRDSNKRHSEGCSRKKNAGRRPRRSELLQSSVFVALPLDVPAALYCACGCKQSK